ncbi:MAG TPA: hypothetical protein QF517_00375 [Pseudomonadales bacterium]|jgi:hypothetical protein|nr:hypothetical protein [Gammaproteobacteria bacterium]MDP6025251.1 hypothetical protein [Pseudomonadales bacterium]MDP6315306.1 hypothetical protein [Pseudomonadales bacterium]MDP7314754.1 hypothetical protein [Pseudomonadales bacterium]MDP7576626.1 hypothetical protein [Pseudomonadales bacterium]|tara:strand:- start:782 stop:1339 length:558 start_codon:yes stop_codon:yes gene_type:complete
MNPQIGWARWTIGILMLGSVLLFGIYGVAVNTKEGEPSRYVKDATYIEECGACHLAFHPGLLPEKSWQGIMKSLEDHFGDNAELDQETASHLSTYLKEQALKKGTPTRISKMLRNMPEEPPLRITELPAFIAAHHEVAKQFEVEKHKEGFLSPCDDCHRQAASGIFDKNQLQPGYGIKELGDTQT